MINQLQQLGLSEKEAKVYLASLELGSSSVQEIAHKAGINRPTAYFQIELLIKKGLMSSVTKGKKRYFSAESPEQLIRLLDIQEKEVKSKRDSFQKFLPELEKIFDLSEEKPKVRFFEGIEGFEAMQADILKTKRKTLEVVIPIDEVEKVFRAYPEFSKKRKSAAVPVRTIYTSQKKNGLSSKEDLIERRFVPIEKFPFSAEIDIYSDDKVAIFSMKNKLVGVIIENNEIVNTLRLIFNLAWEAAEKYN